MIALVLMKEQSSRVLGKNHREMCGKPLFCYILTALQNCWLVEDILVNVDGYILEEKVKVWFPGLKVVQRPEEMKQEFDINGRYIFADIIEWSMEQAGGNDFLHVHATSPHLTPETIDGAIQAYRKSNNDSLMGVTAHHKPFWSKSGPLNHSPAVMVRSQDIEPYYEDNSTIYIFSRDSFFENGGRVGSNPLLYPVSKVEAIDIDTEEDWTIAEAVMHAKLNRQKNVS